MKRSWPIIIASIVYFSVVVSVQATTANTSAKTNIRVNNTSVTIDDEDVSIESKPSVEVEVYKNGDSSTSKLKRTIQSANPSVSNSLKRYAVIRDQYRSKFKDYQTAKGEFTQARRMYLKDSDTYEGDFVSTSKHWLGQGIQVLLTHLESIEAKINESNNLSDGNKQLLLAEVAEAKVYLQSQSDLLDSAETLAEIRQISKDVKVYWKELKPKIRIWLSKWSGYKVGHWLSRVESLSVDLADRIMELEGEQADLASQALVEANTAVAQARAEYALAVFVYSTDPSQESQYLRQAHTYLRGAHQSLKEVLQLLKNSQKLE